MKKQTAIIFLFIIGIFFFFNTGCIQVKKEDRLDNIEFFDFSKFFDSKKYDKPCYAMLCQKKDIGLWTSFTNFIKKIFGGKIIENDIAYSDCDFYLTDAQDYTKLLNGFDQNKGWWPNCQIEGVKYPCSPRFFMIGQGSNMGEFSYAQRYCDGTLNMPVNWIIPDKNGKIKPPSISWLSCENSKSHIPVIVYRSLDYAQDGRLIDSTEFKNLVENLKEKGGENYYGPIIVSTEALAKPYYYDETLKKEMLNISLLQKISNQIKIIKTNCESCLVMLALEPTFNSSGFPDLCPLDYFMKIKSISKGSFDPDPLNCSQYYQSYADYALRAAQTLTYFPDIVGVGFIANNYNYSNFSSCSPSFVVNQHILYSIEVIKHFEKPTLWYAIGISEGPTVQPNCEFTKEEVANSYKSLIEAIEFLRGKGIIGIAPYKFLNQIDQLPIPCISQKTVFNSLANFVNLAILKNGDEIVSADNSQKILINRIFSKKKDSVYFEGQDGNYYLAYKKNNLIEVNKTGCQFGFKNNDNTIHNNASLFFWFSHCQYYFLNRGTLFYTDTNPGDIKEGEFLVSSSSDASKIFIDKIEYKKNEEIGFYDRTGSYYIVKKDGNFNKAYQATPNFLSYTQSPLIFPRNGIFTPACVVFNSGGAEKLYATKSYLMSSFEHASKTELQEPRDPELQKNISLLQCGICLFSSPMPKEFCDIGQSASFNSKACTQYPQMDVAFLLNNADPIFMRAIAVTESGLGSRPDQGSSAPACQIGKGTNYANCNAQYKSLANLQSKANDYCSAYDIEANYPKNSLVPCGLGVMQCIDFPNYKKCGDSYNPFNPYDSACCGSDKFMTYYAWAKQLIENVRTSNKYIEKEVTYEKKDWYAALIALYRYLGIGIDKAYMEAYSTAEPDEKNNFATYLYEYYYSKSNRPSEQEYGIKILKRYNEMIKECGSGCAYQEC